MRRLRAEIGLHVLTVAVCALGLPGCANFRLPQIDPSGECLFLDPAASNPQAAFRETPPTGEPSNRPGIILCPRATVAPVGSEVVLLAGVRGPDEYLRTNERVEWMIDPGSVGQFVDLDRGSWTDALVGDFTKAKKIDNCYAVNTTSRRLLRLTRGTPDTSDDVEVLKGQAWVTLTSAREGTSDVTVYCPGVTPWEARRESCQVHWVDAQWSFPSVSIAESGGRQILTTTVTRQTDGAPRCGWIVRYEICDGPPAGFAPDGSQAVEVSTDEQGKAVVELVQTQPQAGTNNISIQVIRPAGLGCPDQRLVIGRTCLAQTWSAADLGVRIAGPSAGSVGSNLGFRIDVSNPGDMAAEGVSLTVPVPPGLRYVSASPNSEGAGNTLHWTVGRLSPGEVRSIALDLRSERAGQYEVCAQAVAASGLSARNCASVAVETAELTVDVSGPMEATVGDSVTHRVVVTNRSNVPATGLIIVDDRDRGLKHDVPELRIEKLLGDLGPLQSQEVTITFQTLAAGRQCHTVTITGAGNLKASRRVCIDVRQAPAAPPGPEPQPSPNQPSWNQPESPVTPPEPPYTPPYTQPPVRNFPRIELNAYFAVGGEPPVPISAATEGDSVLLILDVSSPDGEPLNDLTVSIEMDESFKPLEASEAWKRDGATLYWENQSVQADSLGRYAVKCLCQTAKPSACFRATVSDGSGQPSRRDECIPIHPSQTPGAMAPSAPGTEAARGLDVKINTTYKPVSRGRNFAYQVLVTNLGDTEERDVSLAVAFPAGLTPQYWQTRGPTRVHIRENVVRCETIPSLPAGTQVEYTIMVTAEEVGEFTVRADTKSLDHPAPVSGTDTIRVTAGP